MENQNIQENLTPTTTVSDTVQAPQTPFVQNPEKLSGSPEQIAEPVNGWCQ